MASVARENKVTYYKNIALAIARRSTCLDNQYGAIIVKNDEIIATGYNGAVRSGINCCEQGHCMADKNNKYQTCIAVHAEQNAIIQAARKDMIGATMYLVSLQKADVKPCDVCAKMIINAGITQLITLKRTFVIHDGALWEV